MRRLIDQLFSATKQPSHGRVVNWKLLCVSLVLLAVALPSLHFWQRYQLRRNAYGLLERATALEGEGKWREAADYAYRYLVLVPDDPAARAQLARAFGKSAITPVQQRRAIELYYLAAGVNTGEVQRECNRNAMALLWELGRHEEAVQQAELVLKGAPEDLSALRIRALAQLAGYREGTLSTARIVQAGLFEQLRATWELQPQDLELAGAMAIVYREQPELLPLDLTRVEGERERRADAVMDRLVEVAANNPRAHVSRFLYRTQYMLPGAEQDLETATQLGPQDSAVQTLAARYWVGKAKESLERPQTPEVAVQSQQALERAGAIYRHMIENLDDVTELAHVELGDLQSLQGNSDAALETWENGLRILRGSSLALNMRLAEGLTDRDEVDRAVEQVERVQAEFERQSGSDPAGTEMTRRLIQLLRAQLLVARGDLAEAERSLEKVALAGILSDAVGRRAQRVWFALGEARGRIGAWDQAAAAFEQATRLEPRGAGSQFGAAVAWHHAHRLDLAIPYYQQVAKQAESFDLWLSLAEARLEENSSHAESQGDWQSVREALAKARQLAQNAPAGQPAKLWRVTLVEAKLIVAGGDGPDISEADRRKRAAELLKSLETEGAADPECLRELALQYARLGDLAGARRVAAQLEPLVAGDHRFVVVQANLDAVDGRISQAKEALENTLAQTSDVKARIELLRALTGVSLLSQDLATVRTSLESLHELEPWNLQTTTQLAELNVQLADFASAERLQREFDAAGASGRTIGLYCRCLALLAQATGPRDPLVAQARTIQQTLERERPSWCATHALKGRLDEMQGLVAQAAESYGEALNLGERRPWVLERQAMLLIQLHRYEESELLLRRLQANGALQGQLILAPNDDRDLSPLLEMAQRAAERNPRDAQPRIWLGYLLLRKSRESTPPDLASLSSAKQCFEEALKIAPRDASAWNGLFAYHVQTGQKPEARRVLDEFVANCTSDEAQRVFVRAQGYEALEDLEAASREYLRAAELSPANQLVQLRLAGVYWKTDPARAETLLREILRKDPQSQDARRALASLVVGRNGARSLDEALSLVDCGARPERAASADLRLRARLLLQKSTGVAEARREARLLLETLSSRQGEASAEDFYLLGQVCEGLLDFDVAERQFVVAAAAEDCSTEQLVGCAERLLRYQNFDAAGSAIARLGQQEPDLPRTIGLRTQWLKASGRLDEAQTELQTWADLGWSSSPDARRKVEHCTAAARIYESMEMLSQAETWRRRAHELDSNSYPALALNLALQGGGKSQEAMQLCLTASRAENSPRSAIALASVVVASNTHGPLDPAIPQTLKAALDRDAKNPDLLIALANVDVVMGDETAAVAKYEQICRLRPQDAEVMNNLASLLADFPERHAEALELVRKARDRAGDNLQLLDTEAQILLSQGNADAAINRLEQAASADPLDPRLQIHLAASYHRAALSDKARAALDRVNAASLAREFLTKRDRDLYASLTNELAAATQ